MSILSKKEDDFLWRMSITRRGKKLVWFHRMTREEFVSFLEKALAG